MMDWLNQGAFDWCPSVPWWAAVLACFAAGSLVGWGIRRRRTEAKLARANRSRGQKRAAEGQGGP